MHTLTLTYKKSTKNTHVYEGNNDVLPVAYIQRQALPDKPDTIEITVKAKDDEKNI